MKYRKAEHKEHYTQSFCAEVDDYLYDDENDCLVVVGKINLQEQLQSGLSTALDKILDRFLNGAIDESNVIDSPNVFDRTENITDLADLGEIIEKADYYRQLFNLPDEMSYDDVFVQAQAKLNSLKNSPDQEKIEKVKEENKNEKETIEEKK